MTVGQRVIGHRPTGQQFWMSHLRAALIT